MSASITRQKYLPSRADRILEKTVPTATQGNYYGVGDTTGWLFKGYLTEAEDVAPAKVREEL